MLIGPLLNAEQYVLKRSLHYAFLKVWLYLKLTLTYAFLPARYCISLIMPF